LPRKKTEKPDKSGLILFLLLGLIFFIPFLVVSARRYKLLKANHLPLEGAQRIFESSSIFLPLSWGVVACGFLGFLFVLGFEAESPILMAFLLLLSTPFFVLSYYLALWLGATYFGVVVNKKAGDVTFPIDMANYTLGDWLRLKFIFELGEVDSVPVSAIKRITRQTRDRLYLHGDFGSRGIKFPSKQKRDECLVAIEEALGSRKMMIEFE